MIVSVGYFYFVLAINLFTSAVGSVLTPVSQSGGPGGGGGSGSVTSIVTTGPDGATLDEASQQSTLSNASAGKTYLKYIIHIPPYVVAICYFILYFSLC